MLLCCDFRHNSIALLELNSLHIFAPPFLLSIRYHFWLTFNNSEQSIYLDYKTISGAKLEIIKIAKNESSQWQAEQRKKKSKLIGLWLISLLTHKKWEPKIQYIFFDLQSLFLSFPYIEQKNVSFHLPYIKKTLFLSTLCHDVDASSFPPISRREFNDLAPKKTTLIFCSLPSDWNTAFMRERCVLETFERLHRGSLMMIES